MRISQLVIRLKAIQAMVGDLEVREASDYDGIVEHVEVDEVDVLEDPATHEKYVLVN